jgi:hypothetical protein
MKSVDLKANAAFPRADATWLAENSTGAKQQGSICKQGQNQSMD